MASKKRRGARIRARAPEPLERSIDIEPRNPWLTCGPDTTVKELWRVVEQTGDTTVYHLVFLDRYGWYCEHGRNCPVVAEVRRESRRLAEWRGR
jgi:hypothetical protein